MKAIALAAARALGMIAGSSPNTRVNTTSADLAGKPIPKRPRTNFNYIAAPEKGAGAARAAARLKAHRAFTAGRLKDADLSDTPTRQSRRRKARGKPF